MKGDTWPRLSQTLAYKPHDYLLDPGELRCQRCGHHGTLDRDPEGNGTRLYAWQEHDALDRPEPLAIVLCTRCSDDCIEPHPRLYRRLERNEPYPGLLAICDGCAWREHGACTHPRAQANGGAGVALTIELPQSMHVLTHGGPRGGRRGYWTKVWPKPAEACEQWEERA